MVSVIQSAILTLSTDRKKSELQTLFTTIHQHFFLLFYLVEVRQPLHVFLPLKGSMWNVNFVCFVIQSLTQ